MSSISKKNIAASILLSIITLGLYLIYWEYLLVKNTRAIKNDHSSCAGEVLCLVFVPFYSLYWWYTRGKLVKDSLAGQGYSVAGNEVAYLILGIFGLGIVSMAIMQNDFNAVPVQAETEASNPVSNVFEERDRKIVYVIAVAAVLLGIFAVTRIISNHNSRTIMAQMREATVGDYVTFGSYEQDNNFSNGKEDIEWLVLEKSSSKMLLISRYALDCKQYNTEWTDVTWETCSLRQWLNNDFVSTAFSANEQKLIRTATVPADENPRYDTDPGKATQDKIFLLSIAEANQYFTSDSARQCAPTDYAVANGAYVNSDNGNCYWWLRSPGFLRNRAAAVSPDGGIGEGGSIIDLSGTAVRPALWINLNS